MLNKNFYILIFKFCIFGLIFLNTLSVVYADTAEQDCISLFIDYSTPVDQSLLNDIKTRGIFKIIPIEERAPFEEALFNYYTNKKNLNIELVRSSHVQKQHFDYSLFNYNSRLFTNSLLNIKKQQSFSSTPIILSDLGYDKVSDFFIFTSAGGAWTRGGGKTIKAKMPLNLKELLTTKKAQKFFLIADSFLRSNSLVNSLALIPDIIDNYTKTELKSKLDESSYDIVQKIIRLYNEKKHKYKTKNRKIDSSALSLEISQKIISEYDLKTLSTFCDNIIELLSITTEEIIDNLSQEPQAINIIDLKIAYVSVLSRITQTYIPLDFWTGTHSHSILREYLNSFRNPKSSNSYTLKFYTDNSDVNEFIVESISKYLQATERLSFSLLFGYSELIPPIRINDEDITNKTISWDDDSLQKGTPYLSSFFDYLYQTGRQQELQNLGVKYLLFNNLEVLGPINLEIHAFKQIISKKPRYNSAFILVPRSESYKGGFALITNKSKKIIVEENNVDESIRNDYVFFNTNTAMFNLDTIKSSTKIGFEKKGPFIKIKGNLGDISYNNNTALIEGDLEENYLNFKGYGDYINNGEVLLHHFTKWMRAMIAFDKKYNKK